MAGIGIIVNPHARDYKRSPSLANKLGFIVGDQGSCHATRDLLDVEHLAVDFKDRSIDILGLSGGDGTIHKTLTTFINVYGETPLPKIALLRGGTMNNLASTLNIHGTAEHLLSTLILKYHQGIEFEETEVPMMKINDSYGFLFGMGIGSRFIEEYNERKNGDPTPWRAAKMLFRKMMSIIVHTKPGFRLCERFDANITFDGQAAPFKNYTMIVAGTIKSIGFHTRILCRCNETPGKFHFLGLSMTPAKALMQFFRVLLCLPVKSENVFDVTASRIVIETDLPQNYIVDGDIPGKIRRIEIKAGPQIKFLIL